MSFLDYYKKFTTVQLIENIIEVSYNIAENNGRLTSDGSDCLDLNLDKQQEIKKELLSRLKD